MALTAKSIAKEFQDAIFACIAVMRALASLVFLAPTPSPSPEIPVDGTFSVSTAGTLAITGIPSTLNFTFNGNSGQPMLILHADGSIEIPPGVTTDEAARAFWKSVERLRPDCPQAGGR